MPNATNGPLEGLRILDLTRLLPGPLGTMLLADMGAEVIKIERPQQPDYVRAFPPYLNGESVNYLAYNRSKKSLALDYAHEKGREVFFDLIRTADVVVEQFRPGFLDTLGIGYKVAKGINPKIIYISITGYGQTGPYSHLAGHDLNYIATAGILDMTGQADALPEIPGVQLADIAGGSYMGVIGLLSALYARERTGVGQHVDVSMTDAVMPLLSVGYGLFGATGFTQPRGGGFLSGGTLNYALYACQDEKNIALGTLEAKFWHKFCDLTGHPDWKPWMWPNPSQEQKNAVSNLFKTKTQHDWVQWGNANDLLISPVNTLSDLETDPHIVARDMVIETQTSVGKIKQIGIPLKFSDTPPSIQNAAPKMGEDTLDLIQKLGYDDEQIEFLKDNGIILT